MQPKLKVEQMPVDALAPYAGNAKEHPDWQVEQIARSIDQFGFNDPVGVWHDKDGTPVIVEGHGRVLAAKRLGIAEVPVIALDYLDDDGRRAYCLAHNQTTLTSGFDVDALRAEMDALADSGIDMADFGFDADGLSLGDDVEPIDDTDNGGVSQTGSYIRWDGHEVTLSEGELGELNAAYDSYLEKNGVTIGLFRSILDAAD